MFRIHIWVVKKRISLANIWMETGRRDSNIYCLIQNSFFHNHSHVLEMQLEKNDSLTEECFPIQYKRKETADIVRRSFSLPHLLTLRGVFCC